MKLKKTVPAIILSLVLIILAGIVILWNMPQLTDGEYIDCIIEKILPAEGNLHIKIGSIDRNFLRSLNLNNVEVYIYDELAFQSQKISIQIGLPDLIRLVFSKPLKNINAAAFDSRAIITDVVLDLFSDAGGEGETSAALGIDLDVRSLDLTVRTSLLNADSENINAYVQMTDKLNVTLNAPVLDVESDYASAFVSGIEAGLVVSPSREMSISLKAREVEAGTGYGKIRTELLDVFADFDNTGPVSVSVGLSQLSVEDVESEYLDTLMLDNFSGVFGFEDSNLTLKVENADISGTSPLKEVGHFDFGLSGNIVFKDQDILSCDANLNVSNFTCDVIPVPASLSGSYRKDGVTLQLETDGLDLSASYLFQTKNLSLSMTFNSFTAYPYMKLFELYMPAAADFIDESTQFNAYLNAEGFAEPENPRGHVTLNAAVNDLQLSNGFQFNGGLSLDTDVSDGIINVNTLALSALGYTLTYNGIFDLSTLFPQGTLLISDSDNGSEVADFSFELAENNEFYTYSGRFAFN